MQKLYNWLSSAPTASRWNLLFTFAFLFPLLATAQEWTYLPLPLDMRNTSVVTTASVRARCASVGVSTSGQRSCQRSLIPPSFAQDHEIIETVPAGFPLKLLEVHYDQDGYALRVVGEREPFWIFEPHTGASTVSMNGQPLKNSLQNVYTAHLAGDMAAIFGPQDVQLQCFPGTVVIDGPVPEVVSPEPDPSTSEHQAPEFDFHAASLGNKFSPNCKSFIDEDGEYGEWGKIIESELKSRDHLEIFLSDQAGQVKNMNRICPNFNQLTKEQKIRFWVWTYMSIAQVESTCVSGKEGGQPSAQGYLAQGLLQMENLNESLDGKRSIWAKNPNPERACASSNIKDNAADNLRCGLDAMANVLTGYHSCSKQEFIGQPPVITEENCVPNILHNKWEKFVCLPEQVPTTPSCQDNREGIGNQDAIVQRILTLKLCGAQP